MEPIPKATITRRIPMEDTGTPTPVQVSIQSAPVALQLRSSCALVALQLHSSCALDVRPALGHNFRSTAPLEGRFGNRSDLDIAQSAAPKV